MASIQDALDELRTCVTENLCTKCPVTIMPGAVPTFVGTDAAWIRLATSFPTTTFPQPESRLNNCAATMAYVVEVGITRCIPVTNRQGFTPAELEKNALQVATDMEDLLSALRCCLEGWDMVLGQWTPTGPGVSAGGFWTITIGPEYP